MRFVRVVLIALALVAFTATAGNAKAGARSAAACHRDGYLDAYDQRGNPFANVRECVLYAARGGELVLLKVTAYWPYRDGITGEPLPDYWAYSLDADGLQQAPGPYDMTAWLWTFPGPLFGGSAGSQSGSLHGFTWIQPCSAGITAIYATAITQEGYTVTSRVTPSACP